MHNLACIATPQPGLQGIAQAASISILVCVSFAYKTKLGFRKNQSGSYSGRDDFKMPIMTQCLKGQISYYSGFSQYASENAGKPFNHIFSSSCILVFGINP